jgi:hypothetical protein
LIVIVDTAGLVSTTVNLILEFVDAIHPDTKPVESVDPAAGIATFVTPPTGSMYAGAKVIVVGATASTEGDVLLAEFPPPPQLLKTTKITNEMS